MKVRFSNNSHLTGSFDGVRFDSWSCGPSTLGSCNATSTSLSEPGKNSALTPSCARSSPLTYPPLPVVANFMPSVNGPITGRLSGYLKMDKLTHVTVWIDGQNVGARLNVDGSRVVDSFLVQPKMNSSAEFALSEDSIHFFILEFFSLTNSSQRNIRILWKTESQSGHDHSGTSDVVKVVPDLFYSSNSTYSYSILYKLTCLSFY